MSSIGISSCFVAYFLRPFRVFSSQDILYLIASVLNTNVPFNGPVFSSKIESYTILTYISRAKTIEMQNNASRCRIERIFMFDWLWKLCAKSRLHKFLTNSSKSTRSMISNSEQGR